MKQKIKVTTDYIQCLYSQNIEYHAYGNCKRHLQILFPFRSEMNTEDKYPLILFIPGSAWHKQELYNNIPQYATLAKKASCAMYITENIKLPPVLLIHCENDPIVSVDNSRLLYDRLTAAKQDVLYYEIEANDAHGGAVFYDDRILDIIHHFCDRSIRP